MQIEILGETDAEERGIFRPGEPKKEELQSYKNYDKSKIVPCNDSNFSCTRGFSLVEMLTVVAVIGIMAAIALPTLGRVHDAAETSKDQSNAQQIVSIYHAAQAMGLNFDGADKMETIANVVGGGKVGRGCFKGTFFGYLNLSTQEQERASAFIEVAGEALQYVGTSTIQQ